MKYVKKSAPVTNIFSVVVGAFLFSEGIWGLYSDVVFGVLTTNLLHAIIHILLGITGVTLGLKQTAKGFCIFLGLLLIVVGVLWFIPGADTLVINLLNVSKPVACFNILVGIFSLVAAAKKPHVQPVKA